MQSGHSYILCRWQNMLLGPVKYFNFENFLLSLWCTVLHVLFGGGGCCTCTFSSLTVFHEVLQLQKTRRQSQHWHGRRFSTTGHQRAVIRDQRSGKWNEGGQLVDLGILVPLMLAWCAALSVSSMPNIVTLPLSVQSDPSYSDYGVTVAICPAVWLWNSWGFG